MSGVTRLPRRPSERRRPLLNMVRLVVAGGVLAAAMLVPAAVSQANHTTRVDHPADPGWGVVGTNHHNYAVCDGQGDGHETWLRIWQQGSSGWFSTGHDSYGNNASGQFCFHSSVAFTPIRRVAICVSYEGCSAWKGVTE
jgi:hypothetical protein